jgi:ABC-type nitrate/sulfonate/bicarbonate transport system substrate-binding protein
MRYLRLVLLVPLLLAVACDAGPSDGGSSRPVVTIALDWVPNTNHTGVFVAKQKGWYDEEKLNVRILPYSEGSTPDVQVAAGKADFGFSFQEAVTQARAAGQPVVSVAAVIQKNSSALVTLKDSGLDRPSKLNGKRYAGFGAPFEEPVINAMLTCDGVAAPRFENVTANTFGFQALQAKQADFVWIFMGWEGIAAARQDVGLNAFPPTSFCIPNYYTPVIITNESMTREKADIVRRFMRATARGYELAIADPDQAADLLIKAAPRGSFPDAALVQESARFLAPKYKEGKARWGEQDLAVWTEYPRFMIKSGRLQDANGRTVTADLDYAAFFTNDFLPDGPSK